MKAVVGRDMFCYIFSSDLGNFAVLASNTVSGATLHELASVCFDRVLGAGTNDKFHGPTMALPVIGEVK